GNVQGQTIDVGIGFSEVDEAGGNEEVNEAVQLELLDAVQGEFAAFVADYDDLQAMAFLDLADEVHGAGQRLGLREHEVLESGRSKRPLFIEDDPIQVLRERDLADLVGIE